MEEDKNTQQKKNRSSYRNSFAATLLFSGVQVYQIIIRIVKSKFVALFIGTSGMGIQSLLHSTTDIISAATNLGLNTSSVKTIAAANRDGDKDFIAKNVSVLRRLILLTGIFGMLLCAVLSPIWSNTSFGNDAYIWSFVIVSSIILLDQLNKGELALLQGMQQKKSLAKANVIGQTLNALITIPLYYFFGVKAIVAAMVLGSLISLVISRVYSNRLNVPKIDLTWHETFTMGREMIKLGFFLSLQYVMSTLIVWIVRNYISNTGGIDEVGLYSAGTMIVTTYIGLVFAAVSTDYYPRLAATRSNEEMNEAVRTQVELTLLLLTPIVVAFIVFCRPVIVLLYSQKFIPIEYMMYWSIAAVLLKALGWALSHTLLAKAKPSYFFFNELATALYGTPIQMFCYKYWGLTGFGMATMVVYGLYLIQVIIVTKKLFGISYEKSIWKLFFFLCLPVAVTVLVKLFIPGLWAYFFGTIILIFVSWYVLNQLNKKMDLKSYMVIKINKIKSK